MMATLSSRTMFSLSSAILQEKISSYMEETESTWLCAAAVSGARDQNLLGFARRQPPLVYALIVRVECAVADVPDVKDDGDGEGADEGFQMSSGYRPDHNGHAGNFPPPIARKTSLCALTDCLN